MGKEASIAGRIEGLSDLEGRLFIDMMPPEPTMRGRGMPHTAFRKIVNTLWYLLIPGCRWCDTPRRPLGASKSAAHRWLQRWQADGTLAAMQARVLGLAEEHGMIHWENGAVEGAFPFGQGGDEDVARGGKGKGIPIHPTFRIMLSIASHFRGPVKVFYNLLTTRGDCYVRATHVLEPSLGSPRSCGWHVRRTGDWRRDRPRHLTRPRKAGPHGGRSGHSDGAQ